MQHGYVIEPHYLKEKMTNIQIKDESQKYAEQKKQEMKEYTLHNPTYMTLFRENESYLQHQKANQSSSNCTHKLYLNKHDFKKLQELSI